MEKAPEGEQENRKRRDRQPQHKQHRLADRDPLDGTEDRGAKLHEQYILYAEADGDLPGLPEDVIGAHGVSPRIVELVRQRRRDHEEEKVGKGDILWVDQGPVARSGDGD